WSGSATATTSTNDVTASRSPSLTLTQTVLHPLTFARGVMESVRVAPVPPKRTFSTGTSSGFEVPTINCRSPGADSASPMVNDQAGIGMPSVTVRSAQALICGGVFGDAGGFAPPVGASTPGATADIAIANSESPPALKAATRYQ